VRVEHASPREQHVRPRVCVVNGESKERKTEESAGGRGARKPVTSNYTARFIIYCRQFLLPPRRCIRPAIEGWFVRRALSNPRGRSMRRRAPRAIGSRIAIWISFSVVADRYSLPFLFSLVFPRRNISQSRQLRGTTRTCKTKRSMSYHRERGRDRGKSETRRSVRMAFHLANAMTPRHALRKTYMLPDSFRYSITATRDIARRARRKNVINRSLARSSAAMYCVNAYKSARTYPRLVSPRTHIDTQPSRAKGSILECRANTPITASTKPESRIQIELAPMKTLEMRKLLLKLTVKSL